MNNVFRQCKIFSLVQLEKSIFEKLNIISVFCIKIFIWIVYDTFLHKNRTILNWLRLLKIRQRFKSTILAIFTEKNNFVKKIGPPSKKSRGHNFQFQSLKTIDHDLHCCHFYGKAHSNIESCSYWQFVREKNLTGTFLTKINNAGVNIMKYIFGQLVYALN